MALGVPYRGTESADEYGIGILFEMTSFLTYGIHDLKHRGIFLTSDQVMQATETLSEYHTLPTRSITGSWKQNRINRSECLHRESSYLAALRT
jgi:hypothetical protein